MVRTLVFAVAGAAVALALVALGMGAWLYTSLPGADAIRRVAGLDAAVEIVRDGHGVPHIFARSERDAFFALGFAHAQDRLWQMETMRRLGRGRLAEILGAKALASDRLMRVLGLDRLVETQYARLDAPVREALDAYAEGVNAWRSAHWGSLPPEFVALGLEPEPWRAADSLLWGKIMALQLGGNWRDELFRAQLAKKLPPEKIAELWPDRPEDAVAQISQLADLSIPSTDVLATALPPAPPRASASNAWVVAADAAKGTKPVLANDPHLAFTAPILWYLARIETPERSLVGATVPGVPFLILGHTRDIAWGMTTTQADLQDLFIEQVDPGDAGHYRTPEGTEAFATRDEIIRVRGAADVSLTVRVTRHGPVISDVVPSARAAAGEGKVLALAATFLREDDMTPRAMYRVNHARAWDEFVAALEDFHAPVQNIHYADIAGNIGFIAPGRVPVRKGGRGWVPSPGWTGQADWDGFVPFDRLPRLFNPREGRLVSANNKIVSDDYPHFLSHDWDSGYRARRIHRALDEDKAPSLDGHARLQNDVVSLMAGELLPAMTRSPPSEGSREKVLARMRAWPGAMNRRQPEPLIFSHWLRELNRALYEDELGELFPRHWGMRPRFVAHALKSESPWCDDANTAEKEDCASRVALALTRAMRELERNHGPDVARWRWGDAHRARFAHGLFTGIPILGRLADLTIETDGGQDTVNRGTSRVSDARAPFEHVHGPGYRAIYDLGALDQSRFMIATGQSGNLLSPHYRDLLDDWRDGRYLRLGLARADLLAGAKGTLRLEPKP